MENRNPIVWIVVVLIIIAVAIFAWKYYGKDRLAGNDNGNATTTDDGVPMQTINAMHQFKNGKHILAGQVDLPTPCHILTTNVTIGKSLPEDVIIDFVSSSQAEFCAQVITPARFKTEFTASENAVIKATWNGKPADLRLTPPPAGEDLVNFELFIKA